MLEDRVRGLSRNLEELKDIAAEKTV